MEKQRLLYQQARLHNRGAAEMVLQMISACKGASTCTSPAPTHPASCSSHPCMWFALCPLHTCLAMSHPFLQS